MFQLRASKPRTESHLCESLPHPFGKDAGQSNQCQSPLGGTPWEKIFRPASVRLRTPGNV